MATSAHPPPVANPLGAAAEEGPALRLVGTPRSVMVASAAGLTLRDMANAFLTAKQRRVDAEEMGLRSFSEQFATETRVLKFLGKHKRR